MQRTKEEPGMKVGHFSESYRPCVDGVATFIQDFVPQLDSLGFRGLVYTSTPGRKENNVRRIRSLPFPFYSNYWVSYFWIRQYARLAREDEIQLVHIHTPFMAGVGGILASKEMSIPVLGTFHSNFTNMARAMGSTPYIYFVSDLFNRFGVGVYNRCQLVTAPTESEREFLVRSGLKTPVEIVPPGVRLSQLVSEKGRIDFRSRLKIPDHAKIILYLGRLTVDKGVYLLLDSFKGLVSRSNVYLIYAGLGPELKALRKEASRSKWARRVMVLGYVKENHKASLISQADVVVLPSRGDTFGLSLAEGMALERVVVASNRGGLRDWVKDGFNGLVFDYGKKGDLLKKIEYALSTDLSDMTKKASSWALNTIDISATAKRFAEIYQRLIHES